MMLHNEVLKILLQSTICYAVLTIIVKGSIVEFEPFHVVRKEKLAALYQLNTERIINSVPLNAATSR